jgi:hypothetical protein
VISLLKKTFVRLSFSLSVSLRLFICLYGLPTCLRLESNPDRLALPFLNKANLSAVLLKLSLFMLE